MKVDRDCKAHGRAAALQLVLQIAKNPVLFEDENPEGQQRLHDLTRDYLAGLQRAAEPAKQGFLEVFGDWLASAAAGAVPCDPADYYGKPEHNDGRQAPSPRERQSHARAWLGPQLKNRLLTKKQGKARFARLLRELEHLNWKSDAPVTSQRAVDRALEDVARGTPAARAGFTSLLTQWTAAQVVGFGYDVSSFIGTDADPADEAHFARLTAKRDAEIDDAMKRADARKATRRAAKPRKDTGTAATASAPA